MNVKGGRKQVSDSTHHKSIKEGRFL